MGQWRSIVELKENQYVAGVLPLVRWVFVLLVAGIAGASSTVAGAQSRAGGPWWPQPEWGADDQAGASNRITPAKIVEAFSLVRTGQVYEVGQIYASDMPLGNGRTYGMKLVPAVTGVGGTNRVLYNDEFLAAEIGQVGTQFDGLGHVGAEVRYADGTLGRVFYNGFSADEMNAGGGLRALGIEQIRPIMTRGVLIDLPAYKGVDVLEAGYEVTLADVRGALAYQGLEESSFTPGDAVLFRYGWARYWDDPAVYNNPSLPGIGLEVAAWLVDLRITIVGSDTSLTEVAPSPGAGLAIPVHQELMMKNGIFNIENMTFESLAADEAYEFLFIANPIRFRGATGSPLRPLAIR
jgi:kynurenine formamidase